MSITTNSYLFLCPYCGSTAGIIEKCRGTWEADISEFFSDGSGYADNIDITATFDSDKFCTACEHTLCNDEIKDNLIPNPEYGNE